MGRQLIFLQMFEKIASNEWQSVLFVYVFLKR